MSRRKSTKSDAKAAIQSATNDDIWDDRLLIKAYEQAIHLTGSDIAKDIASDTNKMPFLPQPSDTSANDDASEESIQFKVGDFVRATYDVDNTDYEARIISIDEESGDCIIRFLGYENEQTVRLVDLVDSWGEQEQQKQAFEAAAADAAETDSSIVDNEDAYPRELYRNNDLLSSLPVPPIPPLPPTLQASLDDESEHFSAMLMSWYMSGYYTGLYQGHKLAKEQQKKKSSKRK